MELHNKSISYSEIQCLLYNLQLNTAVNGNVKLTDWFINEIQELPNDLDDFNLLAYYNFFEKYGDHVYTKCAIGGLINQFLATDYSYWIKKTIEEIKVESEKTFMVGVEKSKEKRFPIDPCFKEASTVRPYKYYGGAFSESEDNWNEWSSSVLKKDNVVCTNWEAEPITEFMSLDHRTLAKKDLMKTALGLYLMKPACNHIWMSAKRPDNAILKISDVYNCEKEIQSSWWLVSGADSMDECLVSWAYIKGTGSKAVGQTQHLRTDFNKAGVCL